MNRLRGLLLFLVLQPFALCAETEDDIALWAGGMFLWERERGVDYSLEYQARFDENVSSLNNHFFETMAYHKWSDAVLINGGYRYTMRPDRDEHRLYLGGFWDMTRRSRLESGDPEANSELESNFSKQQVEQMVDQFVRSFQKQIMSLP